MQWILAIFLPQHLRVLGIFILYLFSLVFHSFKLSFVCGMTIEFSKNYVPGM